MKTVHTLADDGYEPGLIGRCATLMARYYCQRFGFGAAFETATASALARFVEHFDPARDAFWWVRRHGEIVGCAGVEGQQPPAHGAPAAEFRWFYLDDSTRGQGLGQRLLSEAVRFARRAGCATLALSTHSQLHAAIHLYERAGFVLRGHRAGLHWGRELVLSRYELDLRQEHAVALPGWHSLPRNAKQAAAAQAITC